MTKTWIITWKDIKSFYTSPTLFVVAALSAVVMSWLFPIFLSRFVDMVQQAGWQQQMGQMAQQNLNIHYTVFVQHLSYLNLMFIFFIPALTMRLLSEEKKMGTYDLLLTSPITSWQIITGKLIAGLVAVFGLVFISFIYPLATVFWAEIPWSLLISGYVGIFLVAAYYTAMNTFCSSLTGSALVAYVMSVILNIFVWFVGIGVQLTDNPVMRKVLEHISLNSHLSGFIEGNIRSSTIVFFISVIFLFGFLAERVVESSRWR